MEKFQQTAIIGVGLMGGSLAKALQKHGLSKSIIGWDLNKSSLQIARDKGIIDRAATNIKDAITSSDLIIIAIPTAAITDMLNKINPHVSPRAIIMDLGSTKGKIVKAAKNIFTDHPQPCFIGGHPIAGSEKSGVKYSKADLFTDAPFVLTPLPATPETQLNRIKSLVTALGAQCWVLKPQEHDRFLAWISHLPQLAATTLMKTIAEQKNADEALKLAGSGLKDTTRIAASSSAIWQDIIFTNQENITAILQDYIAELKNLQDIIKNSQVEEFSQLMEEAARSRRNLKNFGSDR